MEDLHSVHKSVVAARGYARSLEYVLESAIANSNPQSYLHDLLVVSLRNVMIVQSKLDVAEKLSEANIKV